MITKLFNKIAVTIGSENKTTNIINSKFIRRDIDKTFADLLKEYDLIPNFNKEIDNANNRIKKLNLEKDNFEEENSKLLQKIKDLKALGLENTPSVRVKEKEIEALKKEFDDKVLKINEEIRNIKQEIKQKEDLQKLTKEYAIKYPGYKFVSEDVMLDIMKKYNLVSGETFLYSKEIPDENLSIINNFKDIVEKSKVDYVVRAESYYHSDGVSKIKVNKVNNDIYKSPYLRYKQQFNDTTSKVEFNWQYYRDKTLRYREHIDTANATYDSIYKVIDKLFPIEENKILYRDALRYEFLRNDYENKYLRDKRKAYQDTKYSKVIGKYSISDLKIIAPKSHFRQPVVNGGLGDIDLFILNPETRCYEYNEEKIKAHNKKVKEVLDPIATLIVPGGRIIMTAWDEEAKIPEIQNTNLN